MHIRRLAAIDVYGTRGTTRRRRIIPGRVRGRCPGDGGHRHLILTHSADAGGRAVGRCFIGAGLNYAPLAVYAVILSRPGALEAELAGVDPGPELRRYGVLQVWILVPLSLIVFAGPDALAGSAKR